MELGTLKENAEYGADETSTSISETSLNGEVVEATADDAVVGTVSADGVVVSENNAVDWESNENQCGAQKPGRGKKCGSCLKKKPDSKAVTSYIAKTALLSAISFILYAFGKFSLPFAFPSFLDIQISELPAILAGFSMGPFSGCIVIVLRCLFKLPLSGTQYVGELTDLVIGLAFVLPASLIYKRHKDKRHALLGLVLSTVIVTALAVVLNAVVSIPFYVEVFFLGNWDVLLSMVRPLYHGVTRENFFSYYLMLGVVPFNILRCSIVSALTFLLYKKLSRILHWDGTPVKRKGRRTAIGSAQSSDLLAKELLEGYNIKDGDNGADGYDNADGDSGAGGYNNVDGYKGAGDYNNADGVTGGETDRICEKGTNVFESHGVEETYAYAKEIANYLKGGEIILLDGDLGAGKTTFTKGLAKALGVTEEVVSPTFTIMNRYESGRLKLNHIDMYRIEHENEIAELGLEEAFSDDSVTVIEWNKFENLSGEILRISIESGDGDFRVFKMSE
jgi:tRNA threonylcarbamoyl adenosine modification protein YjeE